MNKTKTAIELNDASGNPQCVFETKTIEVDVRKSMSTETIFLSGLHLLGITEED